MFVSLVTVLAGCSGSGSFTLHLNPVVATPQAPFEDLDSLELVLTSPAGEALRVSLGEPTSGSTPEAPDIPELADTRVTVEGYRDDVLVTRGLTEPLTADHGTVDADVFVATTEATAWLGALADPLAWPMLAPLGDGRFWLAGGVTNSRTNEPSKAQNATLLLSLAPPGDALSFEAVDVLPDYTDADGDTKSARMGATCTPLTVAGPDQGKLLVAGGADLHPLTDSGQTTKEASLYDPVTDTWEALGNLSDYRTLHLAIENIQGNVVIWGGLGESDRDGVTLPNEVDYYDRASRSFSSLGRAELGSLGAVAGDLGTDGTLLCGGADINGTGWTSTTACVRVRLDGSGLDTFEALPTGVAGAAMIALEDGRILLTGGATAANTVDSAADVPAVASAWLYNPTTGHWGALSSSMAVARAGHRMVLLDDGRVLIVGGAESYNLLEPPADAVSCLEVYNPTTGTFESVQECDATDDAGGLPGRQYLPAVAYDPDYGVLVAGGLGADGSAQGGVGLFVPGE